MNTNVLFPLVATALFTLNLSAATLSSDRQHGETVAAVASHIVDLPTITVRPAPEDAAYFHANRVVDLAAVTVRPEPQDLAYFVASTQIRIVDFPVVTVSAAAEDEVIVAAAMVGAQQVATR